MKLIHFSDTHLGFHDLDATNHRGINQREADFYDAFTHIIDAILLKKPDYVIHTGNLFHSPYPSDYTISFALAELKRLCHAKIPTIIIAGSYSTPRTQKTSCIHSALKSLDYVYPVFEESYEKIEFDDIVFHCIPHINDEMNNVKAIDKCKHSITQDKRNVMMFHCSMGQKYIMEAYESQKNPHQQETLFSKMDYVAIGHWHGFGKVSHHSNAYCAGSTERISHTDTRVDKGYISVDLNASLKTNFHTIILRPSYTLTIDATKDITSQLLSYAQTKDCTGAMIYITLENLSIIESIDMTNNDIKAIFPKALSVHIQRKFIQDEPSMPLESMASISALECSSAS